MNVKEYLSSLEMLDIKIKQLEIEIANLRSSIADLGSALSSSNKVSSSAKNNAGYTYKIEKLSELENELLTRKAVYVLQKDEIIKAIQNIDNPVYVEVLFKKYVEFKTLKNISTEMNYDYVYIRKLHGWALLALKRKIDTQ